MRNHYFHTLPPLGLLTALALSACATQDVAPSSSQLLTPAALAVAETATPYRADWWTALNDNSLNQLVSHADSNSPTLDAANARLRAARASIDSVASTQGLKANGSISVNRSRTSEFDALPPPMLGQWSTLDNLSADISYRFDFWGKTRAQLRAARGQARAAELEASDARQSIAYAVVSSYLEWRSAQASLGLQQQDQMLAANLLQSVQQRAQHGLAQPDDVLQARAQLADADERQLRAKQRIAIASHALAALSASAQPAIDALPAAELPQWQLDTGNISSAQLGSRADIQAARERVEASRSNIDAARADFYPDVRINMLAGLTAQEVGDLFNPGARILRFMPAITLPIFSNGELNARLNSRTAELDTAIASYNQTLLAAVRDTADRSSQLRMLLDAEGANRQALLARRDSADKVKSRLNAGLAARDSWLIEQRKLTQARLSWLDLQSQRLQTQAALIRTLGTAPASAR